MGFIIVIEIQCRDKIASQLLTIPSLEIVDDDFSAARDNSARELLPLPPRSQNGGTAAGRL